MPAKVTVGDLHGDGSSREPNRVTLMISYEGKEAHLEIPMPEPAFDREPGTEAYRREVIEVIAALQEVVDSPEGIQWPYRP